ncbi:RNA chaperone Hfq [Tenuibacillus multivorans]|uniref:RNA chaperone Hfq n=1 Tax=Tenuibacillus multivorans TaxID=237069 RepID=UPI001167E885|nr:RNA chaperone Hfq [Tenuibacillus multivorans]GEL75796.1 RNA-binding protein Hfq [Tenuibacillus multivorans]
MANSTNVQDTYLNKLRKEKVPLTVFLTNGFQLRGVLKSFDNFTILIETEGRQQLIFKHAISTFAPSKNIDLES